MTFSPMDLIEINSTSAYDKSRTIQLRSVSSAKPQRFRCDQPEDVSRVLNEGLKIALLRPNHTSSTALAGLVAET
jgi:hypothetical protein